MSSVLTSLSARKSRTPRSLIMQSVPAEAGVENIFFDGAIGEATMEARKPLQLTVEKGFNPIELTDKTGWKIRIQKTPAHSVHEHQEHQQHSDAERG